MKRPASEPLPQPKVRDSDLEDEEENFMSKRALNIKENKEMVKLVTFNSLWKLTMVWPYLLMATCFTACKAHGRTEQSAWTLSWKADVVNYGNGDKQIVCFIFTSPIGSLYYINICTSSAPTGTSAVHGNPGILQEKPRAFVSAPHTVPLPGGRTSQPTSRGRAWGQVQPGSQKSLLWGSWWTCKSDCTVNHFKKF